MLQLRLTPALHAKLAAALPLLQSSIPSLYHRTKQCLNENARNSAASSAAEEDERTAFIPPAGAANLSNDSIGDLNTGSGGREGVVALSLVEEVSRAAVAEHRRLLRSGSTGSSPTASSGVDTPFYLHEMLRGSQLVYPSSAALNQRSSVKKSPAFAAHLDAIRTQQANAHYQRMVTSAIPPEHRSIVQEFREVRSQLAAAVNILFSMWAVGAAVWWASHTITDDAGIRILMALFASMFLGAAETFLYIRHVNAAARQRRGSLIEDSPVTSVAFPLVGRGRTQSLQEVSVASPSVLAFSR